MDVWHIFIHSLKDCALMLPIMFLTYVLIEVVERKTSFATNGKYLTGKGAPILGATIGTIPQCGVSVMSAKLFDKGIISLGTLLSVFIATSDEAFSILLASDKRLAIVPLIAIKGLLAIGIGLLFNLILHPQKEFNNDVFKHENVCVHCHSETHAGKNARFKIYVVYPILHSFQTFLYVFAIVFAFGILFGEHGLIGEEEFARYLSSVKYTESFIVSLLGLIPSCASSAIITSLFVSGGISFGSLVAGLISNAGVGLAVLLKNTKEIKRNLFILITLYLIGSFSGLFINVVYNLFF
ncbi:MAG: arsenic efflux protein [Clostridia bacterium]|nr:arsenic efflux protein [Clostridia bacterium]